MGGWLGLALLTCVVIWSYWPTFAVLRERWALDPKYSHGYVIPLLSGGLLIYRVRQARREGSAGIAATPSPQPSPTGRGGMGSWWGGPLCLLGSAMHVVGGYTSWEWLEGWSLVPLLCGLIVLNGGWSVLGWSWPGVAFLLFMVPPPYRVELALAQPLQRLAVTASAAAVGLVGLDARTQGNLLIVDEMTIGVVEACNGLGMLMVMLALASAAAVVFQGGMPSKVLLILSAIPIALAANVVRIATSAVLAHHFGSEAAMTFFHDVAGWFMIPLALALLWWEARLLARL